MSPQTFSRRCSEVRHLGKFTFETLHWDDPDSGFPLDAKVAPQVTFDRDGKTTSACDLVVVILWSRMGTPLDSPRGDGTRFRSGTEYEFESATSNPNTRIMLYRRIDEPVVGLRARIGLLRHL